MKFEGLKNHSDVSALRTHPCFFQTPARGRARLRQTVGPENGKSSSCEVQRTLSLPRIRSIFKRVVSEVMGKYSRRKEVIGYLGQRL